MKSIIFRLVLALAALTIVPDALAADSDSGNIFLDAKLGKSTNTTDFTDTGPNTETQSSWGADGGYLWKLDGARSLGFDIGYMHFGTIADSVDANGFFTEQVSASAMTAGVHYEYLFGDDEAWIFQGRAGLMRAKLDSSTYSYIPDGSPPTTFYDSWHESGVYLGAGIGRQITQSFSLTLAYTIYSSSGQQISLSPEWFGLEAEYRF
jgi:hypothetical protein